MSKDCLLSGLAAMVRLVEGRALRCSNLDTGKQSITNSTIRDTKIVVIIRVLAFFVIPLKKITVKNFSGQKAT